MSEATAIDLPAEMADVPITDFAGRVSALPLSDEERQAVSSVRAFIEEQDKDTFLARVEAAIDAEKEAPPDPVDPHRELRRQALRVWWYFGQGLDAGGARHMEEAIRCYRKAAYGFARLGDTAQMGEAVFQGFYSEALQLIRQQNIPEGLARLAEAKDLLERSSSMGTQQREMLASLELEVLLQQSGQAMAVGNQIQAEQLLRRAAEMASGIAGGHGDDDPLGQMWRGQAGMLRAQADLMAGLYAVALYNFDRIAEGESSSAAAAEAARLLADFSPANAATATFCAQLLAVLEDLASVMLRVLSSSFHREKGEFKALRARVMAARRVIPAAAGLDAVRLSQACDQLDAWLNNLERLAKPTKKDLGVYGGFVACAAFCLLLLAVSVVNRAFDLGATAAEIFAACTPLAVVAGFGLAGLKAWRGAGSAATVAPPSP
jgi:hypothetical protein